MNYYSTICVMVKNEERYINEWLQYHRKLGFQHFYIYDNNSNYPVIDFVLDKSDVTCINWNDTEIDRHKRANKHCLKTYKKSTFWMMCSDVDVFVVLKNKDKNINILLRQYEKYGGLSINLLNFGSSNHKKIQNNVIASYLNRAPDNFHPHEYLKTIVNTKHVNEDLFTQHFGIHNFAYHNNYYAINEKFERVTGDTHKTSINVVQLNHYATKSEEDMLIKMKRGGGNGMQRTLEQIKRFDTNHIKDNNAMSFYAH